MWFNVILFVIGGALFMICLAKAEKDYKNGNDD